MVQFGFQMSSVAPYLQTVEEMRDAFRRVAKIGFRDVQLQGIPAEIPEREIVSALQESGLRCIAFQEDYPFSFYRDPQRFIQRAAACGSKYLTIALLPPETDTVEKLERFAQTLRSINEQVKEAGMIFTYHPIGMDFQPMEGVPIFQRLLSLLPEEIQLTFCVYSSFGSHIHYRDILQTYVGRVDLVHFKDGITLNDGAKQLTPLGEGKHDWGPVFTACRKAGVKWIFAEQERWERDAFDCAAASYRYLCSLR